MTQVLLAPLKDLSLGLALSFGAVVFMMGASLGSFLAAAVYRVTTSKKSIAFDRSECTSCGRKLTAIDLVPLFSFLFLRARCRTCKKPISWRYFIIEFASALMTLLTVYQVGLSWVALEVLVASFVFFAILLIDFDTWLIPLPLPLFLMAFGLLFAFWHQDFSDRGLALVLGFVFLALVLIVSTWLLRRTGRLGKDEMAMGWGDPILLGAIGAMVGLKALPFVIWMACVQAIVAYVLLRILRRDFATLAEEAHADQEFTPPAFALPLGTFLGLAAIEILIGRLYL